MNVIWPPTTETAPAAFNPAMTVASAGASGALSVAAVPPPAGPDVGERSDTSSVGSSIPTAPIFFPLNSENHRLSSVPAVMP